MDTIPPGDKSRVYSGCLKTAAIVGIVLAALWVLALAVGGVTFIREMGKPWR